MKPIKIGLAALLLWLGISCTKENSNIQSSVITGESSTQTLSSDGNEGVGANAVTIGAQVWMNKNLNVSRYRNGDKIPQVKNPVAWAALTTGAWCWYNNDSAIGAVYGKLYNWYAVNDSRGLAPEGWHVPKRSEWTTLSAFLGGDAVAGGKMKEAGTLHWVPYNVDATNSSGFTALPGGYRNFDGSFFGLGSSNFLWSSSEGVFDGAASRVLHYFTGSMGKGSGAYKQDGFSVRCIKD